MLFDRSGSADILNNDLIITKDESGRHTIDEPLKTSTSPQPKTPSNKLLSPSKTNNQQVSIIVLTGSQQQVLKMCRCACSLSE